MTTLVKLTLPMPRLGETMDEGVIANWVVAPGQAFKRGDTLLELETDKTLVEYPALGSGTLLETLVAPQDIVSVGAPIAVIETDDRWDGIGAATRAAPATEKTGPAGKHEAVAPATIPATEGKPIPAQGPLRATPLARRIARQRSIDLTTVQGSGRRGRIEVRDVEAAFLAAEAGTMASQRGVRFGRSIPETAPVLCVHGFAGAANNWSAVRSNLNRGGVSSSAADLPGHGSNALEAPHVEALIAWLVDALQKLDQPVHLVGHSLGAHVCAQAARRVPDQMVRLTLIAPAGCGHAINGTFISSLANAKTSGEIAHLMRLLGPKAASLDSKAVSAMADELARGRLHALAADMVRGDAQQIDTITALHDLKGVVPVQAVFGLADTVIPKDHVFNMPPHVACHIVRSGHMPHWDAPGLIARILTAAA